MVELVRSSHKVFKIKYHVVICIKYRKDLFLEERYVATVKNICKDVEDRFYLLFETIDSVLKINSITTTLVAFLGIVLTISGFNNWIFLGIILICVLSLLSSILFGVIAQNNKSQTHKKICYRLFIFGLAFFIFFFAYILIGGIAAEFVKALGESAKTYLNNQTAI